MSASEEDIQASNTITALKPKSLLADTAHHFRRRQILEVTGDLSGLAEIATGPAPKDGERGRFVSLLTAQGFLDADIYVARLKDNFLVDVHADLAEAVADRLAHLSGVSGVDRSAAERWRIFGELPDQKGADTPFEAIRFSDTRRRELGNRVFRDAAEPEGFDWRHARKWDGHAMRLGLLPDHRCVVGKGVTPEEAGYHRLLSGADRRSGAPLERRVLQVRVDQRSATIPVMANAPLMADGDEFGMMLDQEGVCGVGLVRLEPWRDALAAGACLTCRDQPILISWPTWLASESEGRFGPAADLI